MALGASRIGRRGCVGLFSAASNDNPEPRSADIIFYAGAQPVHTLVFEQAANTPYLTITPETGSVPVGGGDITLLVDTNLGEWDYAVASGDGEWLAEKAKTSTSLTLTAAANERFSQLKATVTFSVTGYPDLKQEVEVTQNGFTADLLDLVSITTARPPTSPRCIMSWNVCPGRR